MYERDRQKRQTSINICRTSAKIRQSLLKSASPVDRLQQSRRTGPFSAVQKRLTGIPSLYVPKRLRPAGSWLKKEPVPYDEKQSESVSQSCRNTTATILVTHARTILAVRSNVLSADETPVTWSKIHSPFNG
jgi:hypothetical protein